LVSITCVDKCCMSRHVTLINTCYTYQYTCHTHQHMLHSPTHVILTNTCHTYQYTCHTHQHTCHTHQNMLHSPQYFSYIVATGFNGGGSRREPLTMGKQLVSFITSGCESSSPFFVIYKAWRESTRYW
jgi:hypothetical protein